MRDFPPAFATFGPEGEERAVADPDTRSPAAFLRWHLGQQPWVIAAATVVGFLWQLPMTVGPWLVGKAVDEGILDGSTSRLLRWAGLLALVTVIGATFGIAMHTLVVRSWLIALYGTIQMVVRKALQMGHVLPRRTPTGEVLSVASSDSDEFGALTEITARAGRSSSAYLVVAAHRPRHLAPARPAGAGGGADHRRRALPAAAAAASAAGRRARPQLRAHLDGHRHRRGPARPARDRRGGHVRPQLRAAVPADPSRRGVGRAVAGRDRGGRRAAVGRLPGAPHVGRHPAGPRRRPHGRPAGQLPRVRAVHGRADPPRRASSSPYTLVSSRAVCSCSGVVQ